MATKKEMNVWYGLRRRRLVDPGLIQEHENRQNCQKIVKGSMLFLLKSEMISLPAIPTYLRKKLVTAWIDRRSEIEWSLSGSDVSPSSFFLTELMKDLRNHEKMKYLDILPSLTRLKVRITNKDHKYREILVNFR